MVMILLDCGRCNLPLEGSKSEDHPRNRKWLVKHSFFASKSSKWMVKAP